MAGTEFKVNIPETAQWPTSQDVGSFTWDQLFSLCQQQAKTLEELQATIANLSETVAYQGFFVINNPLYLYRLYYDFAPGFFPAEMLHFIAADFTGTFTLRDGNLFPFCFDSGKKVFSL